MATAIWRGRHPHPRWKREGKNRTDFVAGVAEEIPPGGSFTPTEAEAIAFRDLIEMPSGARLQTLVRMEPNPEDPSIVEPCYDDIVAWCKNGSTPERDTPPETE